MRKGERGTTVVYADRFIPTDEKRRAAETGEVIQNDGVWRVYEFTWQMDAILFWERFEGRWLRGTEFHYPERPENLPSLKPLENWPKFNPRNVR